MGRYSQTIARLGAGLTTLAALVWLLWPNDFTSLDNPEAWFVLVTSLVFWVIVEFRLSEEIGATPVSKNDIRVGREILDLHAMELRYLLHDTDLWSPIESEVYSNLHDLCMRWNRGQFFFHNRKLNRKLTDVMERLSALSERIAQDTVPDKFAGRFRTGYKPSHIVHQDEYERLRAQSHAANEIATQAWKLLDDLATTIRERLPQALDELP